jgi:hypothetical protein
VPSDAVAERAEAELRALLIIGCDVTVVRRCPDQVETNPVAPPVRRAFKAGLEEAGEGALVPAHGNR